MNKRWESIDIWNLTNSGHYDFNSNIVAEAKKIPILVEKCGLELTAMEAAVHEEDEALIHALKSPYTKDLWDMDGKRDSRYTNVSEVVRAMTKFPEEMAQKAAAERVLEILNLYKLNTQAQVNKETGVMTNLLQELQGQLADDIATLGLTEIVEQMKTANDKVNEIYNNRLWADSVKVTGRVAKARADVDRCYMALREKVNALVIVFGAEDYSAFIGYVNERIAMAKRWQLAPKRKKGEGTGTDTGEEDTGTEGSEGSEEGSEGGATGGEGTGSEGEQGSETGSEEQEPTMFTVTYIKGQYTWMTQQYAAGDRIVPPAEPEAFRWVDVPEFMPDHDITIYAQYVG